MKVVRKSYNGRKKPKIDQLVTVDGARHRVVAIEVDTDGEIFYLCVRTDDMRVRIGKPQWYPIEFISRCAPLNPSERFEELEMLKRILGKRFDYLEETIASIAEDILGGGFECLDISLIKAARTGMAKRK